MDAKSVEAVVVNYNAGTQLQSAVDSLIADGVDRVWIVDNASEDGSTSFVSGSTYPISLVKPLRNLGYGRAANMGFEKTDSRYVVICNPDIEVLPGAIEKLVNELDSHADCAIVGPRIVGSDGTVYPSVRYFPRLIDAAGHAVLGQIFPRNRFTARYRMLGVDHTVSFIADWVSGAFFLVRSDAFRKVGGFSNKFFMYLEDVFLCRTMGEHGYEVRFCGNAAVLHRHGTSTSSRPLAMIVAHHRSLWTYSRLTKKGLRSVELLPIGVGIAVRFVISILLEFWRRRAKNHGGDPTK